MEVYKEQQFQLQNVWFSVQNSLLNLDFSVFPLVYFVVSIYIFLFCLVLFYFGPLLGNDPLVDKYSRENHSWADFSDRDN